MAIIPEYTPTLRQNLQVPLTSSQCDTNEINTAASINAIVPVVNSAAGNTYPTLASIFTAKIAGSLQNGIVLIADSGYGALIECQYAGAQLIGNGVFSSLSNLIAAQEAGVLPVSGGYGYRVGSAAYMYDGNKLFASDGFQLIRAVGDNASLPDSFYSGAKSTLSYSTHTAHNNILMLGVSVANYLFNESLSAPRTGSGSINGAITVEQAVEYPIGVTTRQRLTFDGQDSVTVAAGVRVDSDLVALTTMIPAGAKYRIWHKRIAYNSGGTWDSVAVDSLCYPVDGGDNLVYQNANPGNFGATTVATGTLSGATSDGGMYANQAVRPACIFGVTDIPAPAVALLGDSKTFGIAEEPDQTRYLGCTERMIGPMLTCQRFGVGGEYGSYFADPVAAPLRKSVINKYFTHAVSAYGYNDVFGNNITINGTTYNGRVTSSTAIAGILAGIAEQVPGLKLYHCTLRPSTTSTDGWITAANQTPAAPNNSGYAGGEAGRLAWNWTVRSNGAGHGSVATPASGGIPGSYGYFDLANDVECNASGVLTQDGGRWLPMVISVATSCTNNVMTLASSVSFNLTGAVVLSGPTGVTVGQHVQYQDASNPLLWHLDGNGFSNWSSGTVVFSNNTLDGIHELPGVNRSHSVINGSPGIIK